jgi:hypothetical protein
MLPVRLAVVVGLVAIAAMLGVVLSHAPLSVAGTNGVPAHLEITTIRKGGVICQAGGTLPEGTTAIRVSLSANVGPRVELSVFSGSRLIADGHREAGWGVTETVTVPVARMPLTVAATRVCTTIGPAAEAIDINGTKTGAGANSHTILLRIEYLRPSRSSWLSLASSLASGMGIAHAGGGAWVAYVAIAAMIAAAAIAVRVLLRELGSADTRS